MSTGSLDYPAYIERQECLRKHRRIYEGIKAAILDNVFEPGSVIPTATEISQRCSVGRSTVSRALLDLESDGYLYTVWWWTPGSFGVSSMSKRREVNMTVKEEPKGWHDEQWVKGIREKSLKELVTLMDFGGGLLKDFPLVLSDGLTAELTVFVEAVQESLMDAVKEASLRDERK